MCGPITFLFILICLAGCRMIYPGHAPGELKSALAASVVLAGLVLFLFSVVTGLIEKHK